jgi:hypothetical protein
MLLHHDDVDDGNDEDADGENDYEDDDVIILV